MYRRRLLLAITLLSAATRAAEFRVTSPSKSDVNIHYVRVLDDALSLQDVAVFNSGDKVVFRDGGIGGDHAIIVENCPNTPTGETTLRGQAMISNGTKFAILEEQHALCVFSKRPHRELAIYDEKGDYVSHVSHLDWFPLRMTANREGDKIAGWVAIQQSNQLFCVDLVTRRAKLGPVGYYPSFDETGHRLRFFRTNDNGQQYELAEWQPPDGLPNPICSFPVGAIPLSVSTDGKWVAAKLIHATESQIVVYRISRQSPVRRVWSSIGYFAWYCPLCSDRLAIWKKGEDSSELWVVENPGENARKRLMSTGLIPFGDSVAWSLDGSKLIWCETTVDMKQGFRLGIWNRQK